MEHLQNVRALNTVIFHRREEDVIFDVEWAAFSALQNEDETELLFYVRAEKKGSPNHTNAEVSIFVKTFVLDELLGKRFEVPRSYNRESEEYVSHIYCYEYKDFDQITLEVLGRDADQFHVRWEGMTGDVDAYDGSEPDNRVVIDAMFGLQQSREATYNHRVVEPRQWPEVEGKEQTVSPDQLLFPFN